MDRVTCTDKNGSRGTRFSATADAWPRRLVAGRGMGAHSGETGEEQWSFNEFCPNFDHPKLKFSYGNMKFDPK